MEALSLHRSPLIDLLTARLSSERTCSKLYDAVIARIRREYPDARALLPTLERHCDESREHEQWLEEQLHALGADVHGTSEMTRLEQREAEGLEAIVMHGDHGLLHLFHALLAAETSDRLGWELLADIADEAGDRPARVELKRRLADDDVHVEFLRDVVRELACSAFLGRRPYVIPAA